MKFVEQAGLVKFDFLGLKTLTVLKKALAHMALRDIHVDLAQTALDDKASYDMLCKGQTVGVFQLESTGMQSVLVNLKPDKFEDIIAVVALYRPGPMDNIPRYVACKHGEKLPDYLHPMLEGILTETYGVIIYQEQVMQIAQVLANYSLGEADLLRRAMGKKIQAEMDIQRIRFNDGAKDNGVAYKKSNDIFDQVNKFAGYGFNKSHAAAYALVSYHTAYLKANYTVEFMAGIMSLDLNNTDKLQIFKQELNDLNISILPPCINHSEVEFSVEEIKGEEDPEFIGGAKTDNKLRGVRYALSGLKNVGSSAMESLVAEREKNGKFKDLSDFCARIDTKMVNKRAIESLAKGGGFDCLNPNRAQIHGAVALILKQAGAATEQRNSNQVSLFGDIVDEPKITLTETLPWDLIEMLKKEQEAFGFYLSAHPLDAYKKTLERQKIVPSNEIKENMESSGKSMIRLAGTIQKMRKNKTKRGTFYAFLSLSDSYGAFEVMIFSEILDKAEELLNSGASVVLTVEVKFGDDGALRLTGQGIEDIDEVASRSAKGLDIFMDDPKNIEAVKQVIDKCKLGRGRITFKMTVDDKGVSGDEAAKKTEVEIELKQRFTISPMIRSALITMPGVQDVKEI
jgi:DNA polymerase-3 subunit alpha